MKRGIPTLLTLLCLWGCAEPLSPRLAALKLKPEEISAEKLVLTAHGYRVELRRESAAARINGTPVQLSSPAVCDDDGKHWDLPAAACDEILRPILSPERHEVRTILIDPGHGGHDKGTVAAAGFMEKELNLALSRELAAILRTAGFTVHLTREDDTFIPLDRRAELAAAKGADLLVSIHHNAAANLGAAGMETHVLRTVSGDEVPRTGKSLRLAFLIQQSCVAAEAAPDRGVKISRFKVLRLSPVPAVLVEAGFLSNPDEAARCASTAGQRRNAEVIARAILRWCRTR